MTKSKVKGKDNYMENVTRKKEIKIIATRRKLIARKRRGKEKRGRDKKRKSKN